MKIHDSVALVTGANRGFGRALALELVKRGARKVYAGVRSDAVELPAGITPIKLDVTEAENVALASSIGQDVNLLINNAGIGRVMGFLDPGTLDTTRAIFETNFYGPIRMSQAFAPIVKRNGGGAIVNILSVASWITSPALAVYATSKTAAWGFTNALRQQLREQGTQVVGVHIGFMDTDMTRLLEAEKLDPAQIAGITLDGVEAGAEEILTDDRTRDVKRGLSANPPVYLSKPES